MTPTRIHLLLYALTVSLAVPHTAHAAVVISNIEFGDYRSDGSGIATSLKFDLVGTVENVVGSNNKGTLYIGSTKDEDWFNGNETQWGFLDASWISRSGSLVPNTAGVNEHATQGDYAVLGILNGEIASGDTIDGTFTAHGGSFNPDATDTSNWIISAGFNEFILPDPTTATGAAVPEPNAFGLFMLGGSISTLRRRRRAVGTSSPNLDRQLAKAHSPKCSV